MEKMKNNGYVGCRVTPRQSTTADPHCEKEKVGELVDTIKYMHTDLYKYTYSQHWDDLIEAEYHGGTARTPEVKVCASFSAH